ncbi:thymidylate kinase [Agrobacterium pusense]|nr:thymidylate kinase [Agrobacterium pusense]
MNSLSSLVGAQTFESTVLSRLFGALSDAAIAYAVLRNYEHLPFRLDARDIDIVVVPEDLSRAVNVVARVAQQFGFRFANYYDDERMRQVALFKRSEQGLFDLKIDFFTSSQVFGIQCMSAQEMLSGHRLHNGIPVVSGVVMVLDKLLFHLAVGKSVHPKYDVLFGEVAWNNRSELQAGLAGSVGGVAADDMMSAIMTDRASSIPVLPVSRRVQMLSRMWRRRKKGASLLMARFVAERVRNRWRPHGLLVSVSGPDGSGKTTVIDLVLAQLRKCYGADSVEYHHFRPTFLPRIAEVAKATGAVKAVDTDYGSPHRAQPSGILGSITRLSYYALDYALGYFRAVRPSLTNRKIVVFDRYYYDMICDPRRSRVRLPSWYLRMVGRLLPLPRFAFFIRVIPEIAYARKQELTRERIMELNDAYGNLVRRGWMIEIDNNGPAERAAAEIVDHIVEHYDAAARRQLKVAAR